MAYTIGDIEKILQVRKNPAGKKPRYTLLGKGSSPYTACKRYLWKAGIQRQGFTDLPPFKIPALRQTLYPGRRQGTALQRAFR